MQNTNSNYPVQEHEVRPLVLVSVDEETGIREYDFA